MKLLFKYLLFYIIAEGNHGKERSDDQSHQSKATQELQDQFDQIEKLRQRNRERVKERIQRKNNG